MGLGNQAFFGKGKILERLGVMLTQNNVDFVRGGELWNRTA
jgi:hypothetical protein